MKMARLGLTALTVGAAVTVMGGLAGTSATKAQIITEYQIPNSVNGSAPSGIGIAAGPDGALSFTLVSPFGGKIGRITTGGAITAFPLPDAGGSPEAITTGPDGTLWFTDLTGVPNGAIGRITTSGAVTEYPVPTPMSLAAGRSSLPANTASTLTGRARVEDRRAP